MDGVYRVNWGKKRMRMMKQKLLVMVLIAMIAPSICAQEGPTPEQVKGALDQLLQVSPDQIANSLKEMKAQVNQWDGEVADLRSKAETMETQVMDLTARLDSLQAILQKFAKGAEIQKPQPEAVAMAPADPSSMTQMASMTPGKQEAVVSYSEHIRPIFEAKCFSCHNRDKRRSGLSLESVSDALEGGSSGEVIVPGKPDASRLFRLINHQEEPKMPLSGDKLDPESIAKIRTWIKQGAPVDANSQILVVEEESTETMPVFIAAEITDGPPPMPEVDLGIPSLDQERPNVARAIAVNPRTPLMAVGSLDQVLLYDLEKNHLIGALPFPEGEIYSMAFSVNGELLVAGGGSVGESGDVVVWNVRTGERAGEFHEGYDTILAVDISPDHKMVAMGDPDGIVKVFSTESKKLLYQCEEHTDWIHSIGFTPDGEVLATGDRAGGLFLWQAANGRKVENLRGHTDAINDMAYTQDSTLLFTAGGDGKVFVWDTWKYSQVRNFSAHDGEVFSIDVSADGQVVTTGENKKVRRWNLEGGHQQDYPDLPDWGYQARFDQVTGKVIAGAWNGDILVWNRDTGEAKMQVSTLPSAIDTAVKGEVVADAGQQTETVE